MCSSTKSLTDNEKVLDSSGTEHRRSVPKGWEVGVLDQSVKKGSSNISLKKIANEEGDYPVFSAQGFAKNVSFFQQEQEYLAIIKDGAGIGRVSKHPAKSSVVATMQYLLPKDGFDIDFIKYFLNSVDFGKHRNGSTIPHIYFKDYKSEQFPLLPLPEQQRIVEILDKAFLAIDQAKRNAEQSIENTKELFESYLQGVFEDKGDDWEIKKLVDVCQKTDTINPKLTPNKEFIYIDVSSVNKETKEIEEATTLLGKNAPSRARKLVKTNDVIFATVRPTHQRVAVVTEHYNEQLCSTGYYVFRPQKTLNSWVIYYFLLTSRFNEDVEKLQKGASYPAVTNKEIETRFISFPKSITKQKQIVEKLNQLSAQTKKLESIYQKKIDNLLELKKSILQKAFSEEL